ncbi:MAG TPA: amylo-alpha-1,6-glucosidase [Ktedonobacteraceae bacterium]
MTQSSSASSPLSYETLESLRIQALTSLQTLQTPLGIMASGQEDHYHAIFGRDSLWSLLLALEAGLLMKENKQARKQSHVSRLESPSDYDAWLHELATTVLRGLASLQGQVVNDFIEEQPGRIIHEYWNPIPPRMIENRWPLVNGRYYGTFDATFLYIVTVAQVDAYFHDKALLAELWPSIEAALNWMLEWSDLDQDGLVEYQRRNPESNGLINQVWKDSSESICSSTREALHYPLAWIEVQGYAWEAYTSYLTLARQQQSLSPSLQQKIEQRMAQLQRGLERFWLADEQIFAIALDGQKQPVSAVSSNPGHLLWSGILNLGQADKVCQRLIQPDLCTPWGLRTLSEKAYYYNPFLYQCGTVWPFDNAITILGMQRHGFSVESRHLAQGILEAIIALSNPVELYIVLSTDQIRLPRLAHQWMLIDYFEACAVQAWTAAGIIYMTSLLLL